jgi:hypothetical protein
MVAQVATSGVTVKCATASKHNVRNCTSKTLYLAIGARRMHAAAYIVEMGLAHGARSAYGTLARRKCDGQQALTARLEELIFDSEQRAYRAFANA